MNQQREPVLEVGGLAFGYGPAMALDDVSLAVHSGEFKVLLGPNGAGKSTLFSLVTGLYHAHHGYVRIGGHDIRRHPTRALARMGVVFQQPTLDLDLSVRQNLLYHAALHGMSRTTARQRIEQELSRMGMAERAAEKIRRMNGGHRRRVEIARALLHSPSLLLLDEPTVGLDVPARRAIVEHVHSLSRTEGIAVLWATHLIDEIGADDSLLLLHRGKVRADGRLDEVLAATGATDVGAAFDRLAGARAT